MRRISGRQKTLIATGACCIALLGLATQLPGRSAEEQPLEYQVGTIDLDRLAKALAPDAIWRATPNSRSTTLDGTDLPRVRKRAAHSGIGTRCASDPAPRSLDELYDSATEAGPVTWLGHACHGTDHTHAEILVTAENSTYRVTIRAIALAIPGRRTAARP